MTGHSSSFWDLLGRYPDEQACIEHLFALRGGNEASCPRCGQETSWRQVRGTPTYVARCCQKPVSTKTGTLFERSKFPLFLWFYAINFLLNRATPTGADFLARHLGVSPTGAFRILSGFRAHLSELCRWLLRSEKSQELYLDEFLYRPVRTRNCRGKGRMT